MQNSRAHEHYCLQANMPDSEPALIDLEMKKLLKAAQTSCLGDADVVTRLVSAIMSLLRIRSHRRSAQHMSRHIAFLRGESEAGYFLHLLVRRRG